MGLMKGCGVMAISKKLVEQLMDSPTALVVNAVAWLGDNCLFTDSTIKYMTPDFPPLCGEAFTIKFTACDKDGIEELDDYYKLLEEMRKTDVPKVVVVEVVGNPLRECVAGDGIAKQFMSANAAGIISNGGHRDIKDILKTGFKVFGSGNVAGHYALRFFDFGKPVEIGGMEVKTGDLIHADIDGCIVIPPNTYDKVVMACRMTLDFEKKVHTNWRISSLSQSEKKEHVEAMVQEMIEAIKNEKSDY